jgi:hypothetical protein
LDFSGALLRALVMTGTASNKQQALARSEEKNRRFDNIIG